MTLRFAPGTGCFGGTDDRERRRVAVPERLGLAEHSADFSTGRLLGPDRIAQARRRRQPPLRRRPFEDARSDRRRSEILVPQYGVPLSPPGKRGEDRQQFAASLGGEQEGTGRETAIASAVGQEGRPRRQCVEIGREVEVRLAPGNDRELPEMGADPGNEQGPVSGAHDLSRLDLLSRPFQRSGEVRVRFLARRRDAHRGNVPEPADVADLAVVELDLARPDRTTILDPEQVTDGNRVLDAGPVQCEIGVEPKIRTPRQKGRRKDLPNRIPGLRSFQSVGDPFEVVPVFGVLPLGGAAVAQVPGLREQNGIVGQELLPGGAVGAVAQFLGGLLLRHDERGLGAGVRIEGVGRQRHHGAEVEIPQQEVAPFALPRVEQAVGYDRAQPPAGSEELKPSLHEQVLAPVAPGGRLQGAVVARPVVGRALGGERRIREDEVELLAHRHGVRRTLPDRREHGTDAGVSREGRQSVADFRPGEDGRGAGGMQQHVDPCREPEIRIDFETEEAVFGPGVATGILLQYLPEHCPGGDRQVVALFLPESEERLSHAVPGGDQEGPGSRRRVGDPRRPLAVASPLLRDRGKPGRPHEEIRDVPVGEELPLGLLVPGSHDAFEEVAQEVHLSVPGSERGEVVRFQPLDGETDLRIGAPPGLAEAFSGHLLLGTVESGLQTDPIHLVEPGEDLVHLLFGRDLEAEAVAGRRGLFVLDFGEEQSRQEVEDLGVGLPAAAPEHIVQLGAQGAQLRGGSRSASGPCRRPESRAFSWPDRSAPRSSRTGEACRPSSTPDASGTHGR